MIACFSFGVTHGAVCSAPAEQITELDPVCVCHYSVWYRAALVG